jgi:hypothetical protein
MKTSTCKMGENAHKITKLIILTQGFCASMVGYEKTKVHNGGSG